MNISVHKIVRNHLEIVFRDHNRYRMRQLPHQLFQQSGAIRIRKMIFHNHNTVGASFRKSQSCMSSRTSIKGISCLN